MNKNLIRFFAITVLIIGINKSNFAQKEVKTIGSVNFVVTTITNGGNEAPKNVSAIWVTDAAGVFQKTLELNAASKKSYLYQWKANSSLNVVDATTGPTLSNYKTYNVTWNCKDKNQAIVPDGDYKIWIEFTDAHQQGPCTSFTFTKGTAPVNLNPANIDKFTNISLTYTPAPSGINENETLLGKVSQYPNPFTNEITIKLENCDNNAILLVYDISGKLINKISSKNGVEFKWNATNFNGNKIESGIYFYSIKSGQNSISGKVILLK